MSDAPDPNAPSRADQVQDRLGQKILELVKIIASVPTGPVADDANDELQLCTAWAQALNDAGADLPPPSADQPLLEAIAGVEKCVGVSSAANNLAQATANLIAAYKAPG